MVGFLVVSHGYTSKGLLNSLSMFFGDNIEALDYLCLMPENSSDEFGQMIDEKIEQLDSGEGVIIFADLQGGTPGNQALIRLSDRVKVIFGVNLPILMEALGQRMCGEVDVEKLTEAGKNSISNSNAFLAACQADDDEL